jgi:hypothetical protein
MLLQAKYCLYLDDSQSKINNDFELMNHYENEYGINFNSNDDIDSKIALKQVSIKS